MARAPIMQALDHPGPSQRRKGQTLSLDDQTRAFWGFSRHWSHERIAQEIGNVHPDTIANLYRRVFNEPELVFRCPGVYEAVPRTTNQYRCGFCPAVRKGETAVRRHVLGHILPVERARDVQLRIDRRRFL